MITNQNKHFSVEIELFHTPETQNLYQYRLSNGSIQVTISNYGCTITSILTPDREGKIENVVAGFTDPLQYFQDHPYFGCLVGRYANRIAFGKFELDGKSYSLPVNDGRNHLHGGFLGFHKKVWKHKDVIHNKDHVGVSFLYSSPDGEEGYPGNLDVKMTYLLTLDNQLIIQYNAVSDHPTIINLTNHSYFNLTGFENPFIYDHKLKVFATRYTEKDNNNIPTGKYIPVYDSPFDFSDFKAIGKDIHSLELDRGYDINFVLDSQDKQVPLVAELYEPVSGRLLKIFTTKPGLQVYTANWWDGSIVGAQGKKYQQHGAIALETQSFPDSPNHVNFPSTILLPGNEYITETRYQFVNQD